MKRNRLPLVVATSATLLVTILSTWVLIQNRTALGGCNAANSPTQVTVDLLVTGTSEPTEESPGKFMCLNDNDNAGGATAGVGNGVSDITESSFPAADPDLVKITLTVTPQAGGSISGESAKLHLPKDSAGATLVKVWSDARKTTLVSTTDPIDFTGIVAASGTTWTKDLWIEGTATGQSSDTTPLKFKFLGSPANDPKCEDWARITVVKVDLDGDFTHDGNVDTADPDDPDEHTTPGLLVPLNEDDDNINGTADKDDTLVSTENDLVKIHLDLLPDTIDSGLVILAAIHLADAGDIKVWESLTKGGTPILDTTTTGSDWKKEWTLSPSSPSFTFGSIPKDLYVEGFNASSGGQITLLLQYQNPVGTTICEDKILVSVIVPELDVGETTRSANRIGWNDPRTVASAKNKIVIWSTDYTANKTQLDVLKYPDIARVYYRLAQRWPLWNSGYPIDSLLTANAQSYNPFHDPYDFDWDFTIHYGPTASERTKYGPYEVYVVSNDDYIEAQRVVNACLVPLAKWSEDLYRIFITGGAWPAGSLYPPTSINGTVSFKTDQDDVAYADLTHKFGAPITVDTPVVISGRRYPSSTATVPVYFWNASSPVNDLFRTDTRVETVVKAFLKKITYAELYSLYSTAPVAPSGVGHVVRWEFSMAPHHKLYWSSKPSESLTGSNDTLLYDIYGMAFSLPPIYNSEPLGALGDVWVVGSDPARQLYGGSGYIDLIVEELTSLDLKIHQDPVINMTVEDVFDFDYFGSIPAKSAASIQCANGRKAPGIGEVKMLRFEVQGKVSNVGNIIVLKP